MNWLLVALGGGSGAMMRYGMSMLVARFWPLAFPLGTCLINILGSFLIGIAAAWLPKLAPSVASDVKHLAMIGVLGGFTTFSSFSLELLTLCQQGKYAMAGVYVVVSVALSLAAVYVGYAIIK